jgi:hypothetical protein
MFGSRYKGLRIHVSHSAMGELFNHGATMDDVASVLEQGRDAPRRRARGTIERWLDRGEKTFNAVVARDYDHTLREEVWVLIHYGCFTRKR